VKDNLSTETIRRLSRGELIIDTLPRGRGQVPEVQVLAVVEAEPGRLWRIIDQVGQYSRFMPSVKASEEVSREGDVVRARVTVDMPFPLKNLTSVTEGIHTVVEGESYVRQWTLVEGDYLENSGSWILVPFEGDPARTLVEYRLLAQPKIRIPQRLQGLAQKKAIPRLIKRLREQVR